MELNSAPKVNLFSAISASEPPSLHDLHAIHAVLQECDLF
jgi:hypothetical protein